jgi:hypothetical protein
MAALSDESEFLRRPHRLLLAQVGSAQAKFAASPHPERWAKAFGRPTAFAEARGWAGASDRSKTGIAGLH